MCSAGESSVASVECRCALICKCVHVVLDRASDVMRVGAWAGREKGVGVADEGEEGV